MNSPRLFFASCLSLTTCGILFAIRSSLVNDLVKHFQSTHEQIGEVLSMGFYGMGVIVLIASPLCDLLGMRRLMWAALSLHLAGLAGFLFAPGTESDPKLFWAKAAMLAIGLAHGLVEGVINPLIATLYPSDKTHKLNVLHAWWPGGVILGGLAAYWLGQQGVDWKLQWCVGFVPALTYGLSILGAQFPKTERVASGVSFTEMVLAIANPLFLVFVACMAVTAATELGTGSWLEAVLRQTASFSGILLLVYGAALMFALRFFAGPIAHRISPIGLLTVSAVLAAIGLWMLSITDNQTMGFAAATVFYVGVCYFWPTMLAVVSERFPRTGALGMGLMGASGFIGSAYFIEWMGGIYQNEGADKAFASATFLPVGLIAVFALIWGYFTMRGGYKAIQLGK
jgi:fucose permease